MAIDDSVLFKAHIDLANSERAAIWSRNAAMLVANSLLLNISERADTFGKTMIFACSGVLVCALWFVMTISGWAFIRAHNQEIFDLTPEGEYPPVANRHFQKEGDLIYLAARTLIIVIGALHVTPVALRL